MSKKSLALLFAVLVVSMLGCGQASQPPSQKGGPQSAPATPTPAPPKPMAESAAPAPGTMKVTSVTPISTEEVAILSEEFKGDSGMWSWQLVEGTLLPGQGMCFETMEDGHIMLHLLDQSIEAENGDALRVTFSEPPGKGENTTPPQTAAVFLYWARSEDVVPGTWPFSGERSEGVIEEKWRTPYLALLECKGHPAWNGRIVHLMITVSFGGGEGRQKYSGKIAKIELLKVRPVRDATQNAHFAGAGHVP